MFSKADLKQFPASASWAHTTPKLLFFGYSHFCRLLSGFFWPVSLFYSLTLLNAQDVFGLFYIFPAPLGHHSFKNVWGLRNQCLYPGNWCYLLMLGVWRLFVLLGSFSKCRNTCTHWFILFLCLCICNKSLLKLFSLYLPPLFLLVVVFETVCSLG